VPHSPAARPASAIPIDESEGAITAPAYAFISNGCAAGTVDAFVCQVNYKDETHNGWAAFAIAHSAFVLSNDIPLCHRGPAGDFVISKVVIALKK
jgi:hypothetical protein